MINKTVMIEWKDGNWPDDRREWPCENSVGGLCIICQPDTNFWYVTHEKTGKRIDAPDYDQTQKESALRLQQWLLKQIPDWNEIEPKNEAWWKARNIVAKIPGRVFSL